MRKNTKENHNRVVFICDKNTCDFICEEGDLSWLTKDNRNLYMALQNSFA